MALDLTEIFGQEPITCGIFLLIAGYIFGIYFSARENSAFLRYTLCLIPPAYFAVMALDKSGNPQTLMIFYILGFVRAMYVEHKEHGGRGLFALIKSCFPERKTSYREPKKSRQKSRSSVIIRQEESDLKHRQKALALRKKELELEKREWELLQKEEQERNLIIQDDTDQDDYLALEKPRGLGVKLLPKPLLRIMGK